MLNKLLSKLKSNYHDNKMFHINFIELFEFIKIIFNVFYSLIELFVMFFENVISCVLCINEIIETFFLFASFFQQMIYFLFLIDV